MKFRHLVLAFPALLTLASLGCSATTNPSGSASDCANNPITPTCNALDYSSLGTDTVHFKDDIFSAIIRPTCNTSACHGVTLQNENATYPAAGLYLGPNTSDTSTTVDATLLAEITGELYGPSHTAPSLNIVKPMDPANSFLMLKLTGCENSQNLSCMVQSLTLSETKTGCGDPMPPSCDAQMSDLELTSAQIQTFARWIAQGAQNN
ncbi:MAG TPA: hypothetical protein VGM44_13755 [Polyangiaceae bacterium]|jgi:hypothetical protein